MPRLCHDVIHAWTLEYVICVVSDRRLMIPGNIGADVMHACNADLMNAHSTQWDGSAGNRDVTQYCHMGKSSLLVHVHNNNV